MKIYFSLKEFCITNPKTISLEIADWIWKYHIYPMAEIRVRLGFKIWPSLKSCYRPKWWERRNKRSGNSQHCFPELTDKEERGACDWTCEDWENNWEHLLEALIHDTNYTRICVYSSKKFIHCDYKNAFNNRYVYKLNEDGDWVKDYKIHNIAA